MSDWNLKLYRVLGWVNVMRAACWSLLLVGASVWADDDHGHAKQRGAAPVNPVYQRECAACHMAYPPGLLPAASWRALTADLPHHFGSDASLDAPTVNQLTQWLVKYADSGPRAPQDRITRMPWFVHEHDEVAASVWRRPSIKTAGNCVACHRGAEQGQFNEHDIRIPR